MHHLVGEEEENVFFLCRAQRTMVRQCALSQRHKPTQIHSISPVWRCCLLKTTLLNAGDCMNGWLVGWFFCMHCLCPCVCVSACCAARQSFSYISTSNAVQIVCVCVRESWKRTFLFSSCLSNADFCLHWSHVTAGPYFNSEFVHLIDNGIIMVCVIRNGRVQKKNNKHFSVFFSFDLF